MQNSKLAEEAKNSNFTQKDVESAYEKGRRIGQYEGMIAYQKKLVDNLQRDNERMNAALADMKK